MKATRSSCHLFRGGGQETARVFAERLEELKQTGCSILVTGTVPVATCRHLASYEDGSRGNR